MLGDTGDVRIDSAEIGPDCYVVCATGGLDGDLTVELGRVLFTLARGHGVQLVADLTGAHSATKTTAGVLTAVAHAVRRENGELVALAGGAVIASAPKSERAVITRGARRCAPSRWG